jgi:hypothetical protein
MNPANPSPTELETLLEALCEECLTPADAVRLEQIVLSSPEAQWQYLAYMDLHGTLYWDAAGAGSAEPLSSEEIPVYVAPLESSPVAARVIAPRRFPRAIAAMSACLLIAVVGISSWPRTPQSVVVVPAIDAGEVSDVEQKAARPAVMRPHGPPITLAASQASPVDISADLVPESGGRVAAVSSQDVVARINEQIQGRWMALGLSPSQRADDAEWLRRVYLDVIGRIPTVPEAEAFLVDTRDKKREILVDELLDDSTYVRNFTTKWTNLLIGRSSNPQVDRDAFQKFLRLSFASNRPWNQIVAELISAEGSNAENGATNFLIAHLNNDATPATAVASKLFLGRQVQCNQCHNNPFDETKQVAFWELNSFFQQTTSLPRQRRDPRTGRSLYAYTELVTQDAGGPTYFETQSGLMRVAYPRYNGHDVDPSPDTNRRRELARLMTYGDQPQLAAAFINRMWEHFFGAGFTRSVDDMGAHEPASHPELLAALSEQFVQSGYDIKQLVRWICRSEPYQLTSRFSETNGSDDPALGELPAFSRMYVKSMTAEQTYDSFLTATKAHQVGAVDWTQAERNRQQWLQQFVVTFHTDDNGETMAFDGSIGNALSLMNGPLIDKALDISAGSFLGEVVRQKSSETDKIRQLCLATLSRQPTPGEFSSMKKLLRDASSSRGGKGPTTEACQDLFWALLNSNEFALIH